MGKTVGALLLLLSGGVACARWIAERRQEQRRLLALAGALERMEGAVRWQLLPLPRVLEQESRRQISGGYMKKICQLVKSEVTLQIAWQIVFGDIAPVEAADILCRTELSGDAAQVTGALHLTAQQLRQLAAERAARQGERERVCVALGVSLTGLLVVLLI